MGNSMTSSLSPFLVATLRSLPDSKRGVIISFLHISTFLPSVIRNACPAYISRLLTDRRAIAELSTHLLQSRDSTLSIVKATLQALNTTSMPDPHWKQPSVIDGKIRNTLSSDLGKPLYQSIQTVRLRRIYYVQSGLFNLIKGNASEKDNKEDDGGDDIGLDINQGGGGEPEEEDKEEVIGSSRVWETLISLLNHDFVLIEIEIEGSLGSTKLSNPIYIRAEKMAAPQVGILISLDQKFDQGANGIKVIRSVDCKGAPLLLREIEQILENANPNYSLRSNNNNNGGSNSKSYYCCWDYAVGAYRRLLRRCIADCSPQEKQRLRKEMKLIAKGRLADKALQDIRRKIPDGAHKLLTSSMSFKNTIRPLQRTITNRFK